MNSQTNALLPVLNQLAKLSLNELKQIGLTREELFTVELLRDPVKWAKEYLNWESRDYQELILSTGSTANRLVLRLGRRLGKTECMCILILWHAFTQINRDFDKADTDPYDILILTPFEAQSKLIFKRLKELIEGSPELKGSIKRNIDGRLELFNGTNIQGMTVGATSGNGAANTRGQRADLIVYDEVDYMGDEEITNTYNIRNEDPTRIKILAASTPSGDRRSFYKWCTGATHNHESDIEHIESTGDIRYNYNRNPEGNGWTHIYAPSTVNKKLLILNPDTGKTGIEELREEFSEMRYEQEVMANFGESMAGVYQKRFIDYSVDLGKTMKIGYASDTRGVNVRDFSKVGPRILGIDWDKKNASTNMVGVHLIQETGIFAPFVRVEIPKHEFTYDDAVKMIIKLNDVYQFDWIFADAGHGEYQIEALRKHGMAHPATGLHHKVVRVNFSEKVTVRDPFTQEKVKKDIKPFMVNNMVVAFERGQFAFNATDKDMIRQFTNYSVERWGQDGRPIYTSEDEHIHDCVMLAMHGFVMKYSDMLKVTTTVHIAKLRPLELGLAGEVDERDLPEPEDKKPIPVNGMAYLGGLKANNRRRSGFGGRRSYGAPRRSNI